MDPAAQSLEITASHTQWLAMVLGVYSLESFDLDAIIKQIAHIALLSYPENTPIIREGEPGGDVFIIFKGTAVVSRGKERLAQLTPGDFFGEIGYLTKATRMATVIAGPEFEVLRIQEEGLNYLASEHPQLLEAMKAAAQKRSPKQ